MHARTVPTVGNRIAGLGCCPWDFGNLQRQSGSRETCMLFDSSCRKHETAEKQRWLCSLCNWYCNKAYSSVTHASVATDRAPRQARGRLLNESFEAKSHLDLDCQKATVAKLSPDERKQLSDVRRPAQPCCPTVFRVPFESSAPLTHTSRLT